MKPTPKRILFIVTSTDCIGPNHRATGYEFSEIAHPYLVFEEQGYQVDFASLAGGAPPEDGFDPMDIQSATFRNGVGFQRLNTSLALGNVDLNHYDAIYFPGGLGPMVDMLHAPLVKQAIVHVFVSGRIVGAVCHGPVALLNVTMPDGSNFIKGRNVAAFTEAEEIGHSEQDVPFMLDAAMTNQGANHTSAAPFKPHVVVDGRLVTGQNPASAAGVAHAMSALLESLSRAALA
jgi:putative intracellular protease/amidase